MDDEAFNAFAAGTWASLLRTAYLMTGDHHAAEDLTQDVLVRLYVAWPRVDDPGAYARVAMSRHVISRWRRGTRRPLETPITPGHEVAVGDIANGVAVRADVMAALRQLPPRQRAVVVLRYFEDWSEARIASELGIATGTVKSQLHKALRRLGGSLRPSGLGVDRPSGSTGGSARAPNAGFPAALPAVSSPAFVEGTRHAHR